MTTDVLIKAFCALVFSGIFAWALFDRDSGNDWNEWNSDRQRYQPYISGALLPACILTLWVMGFLFLDGEKAMQITLSFCFGVFLHICLYYLLLMPALPFLRRHISARACAVLWMLPNYLYLTQMSYMQLPSPRWVVEAPLRLVQLLPVLWLAGFVGVLGWKTISHLIFRARILRPAAPVTNRLVLAVWDREVEDARFHKPKFKLVVSSAVQTPLSVGLLARSVRVVLPERDYTPEELALIFRHELVHIGREDAWNKFFLVFCTAMCWFNPLMWAAAKKSCEDLELSCDETVLLDADDADKHRYADLLLKTAGDEQGFTTCLSASADALRYRLKSVVAPQRKPSGALVVGLTFFLLCMSSGYVALAYGESTGADVIYRSRPTEEYTLRSVELGEYKCTDEAALHRYLSGLRLEQISGNYSFDPEDGTSRSLLFGGPDGALHVTLSDRFLKLVPLYGERISAEYYYLPDGTDWGLLDKFIVERPALTVHVTRAEDPYGQDFAASLSYVGRMDGQDRETLYEMDPRDTPGGMFGHILADRASLSFNYPPEGECTVEIVPLKKGGSSRTLRLDGRSPAFRLSEEPARYTVSGVFSGRDGKRYEMEFQFEIGY